MAATAEAFAVWLDGQGRAANTVAAYRRDVDAYLRWLGATGHDVDAVDGADLSAYLEDLGSRQRSSSVARALVAIRTFHRWCSAEGWLTEDPSSTVGAPAIARPSPRAALGEHGVRRVVDAIAGHGLEARRDRALLLVLYRAGIKATEAVALDLGDVQTAGGRLIVDRGRSHERAIPLLGDVVVALDAWMHPMGRGRFGAGDDALFLNQRGQRLTRQGVWLLCRTAGERAGLADVLAPKDLRQACVAELGSRGVPSERISALLGHGTAVVPSQAELAAACWGGE